jgi:hypothetical protein
MNTLRFSHIVIRPLRIGTLHKMDNANEAIVARLLTVVQTVKDTDVALATLRRVGADHALLSQVVKDGVFYGRDRPIGAGTRDYYVSFQDVYNAALKAVTGKASLTDGVTTAMVAAIIAQVILKALVDMGICTYPGPDIFAESNARQKDKAVIPRTNSLARLIAEHTLIKAVSAMPTVAKKGGTVGHGELFEAVRGIGAAIARAASDAAYHREVSLVIFSYARFFMLNGQLIDVPTADLQPFAELINVFVDDSVVPARPDRTYLQVHRVVINQLIGMLSNHPNVLLIPCETFVGYYDRYVTPVPGNNDKGPIVIRRKSPARAEAGSTVLNGIHLPTYGVYDVERGAEVGAMFDSELTPFGPDAGDQAISMLTERRGTTSIITSASADEVRALACCLAKYVLFARSGSETMPRETTDPNVLINERIERIYVFDGPHYLPQLRHLVADDGTLGSWRETTEAVIVAAFAVEANYGREAFPYYDGAAEHIRRTARLMHVLAGDKWFDQFKSMRKRFDVTGTYVSGYDANDNPQDAVWTAKVNFNEILGLTATWDNLLARPEWLEEREEATAALVLAVLAVVTNDANLLASLSSKVRVYAYDYEGHRLSDSQAIVEATDTPVPSGSADAAELKRARTIATLKPYLGPLGTVLVRSELIAGAMRAGTRSSSPRVVLPRPQNFAEAQASLATRISILDTLRAEISGVDSNVRRLQAQVLALPDATTELATRLLHLERGV